MVRKKIKLVIEYQSPPDEQFHEFDCRVCGRRAESWREGPHFMCDFCLHHSTNPSPITDTLGGRGLPPEFAYHKRGGMLLRSCTAALCHLTAEIKSHG